MDTRKTIGWFLAGAAGVALNFLGAGAFIGIVGGLVGPKWTYVIHFAMGIGLAALFLGVKHLADYVRMENRPEEPRRRARWEFVRRHAALVLLKYARAEKHAEHRMSQGWWPGIRRFGALPFAIIASLAIGPIVSALVMRLMAVEERRAWTYVLIAALITTLVMVKGAGEIIKALF